MVIARASPPIPIAPEQESPLWRERAVSGPGRLTRLRETPADGSAPTTLGQRADASAEATAGSPRSCSSLALKAAGTTVLACAGD